MSDGRTLEMHYQCDIKGIDPGGTNWRAGKGKPPLDTNIDLYQEYLKLWRLWARENPELLEELRSKGPECNYVLSDMFASSEVSQARALADILNGGFYGD